MTVGDWGVRSGASIARVAAGRPLVWGRQGEIRGGHDHPLRVGPAVGEAVVGGQGVVGGRGDGRQGLPLLQAANNVRGEVGGGD